MSGTNFAFFQRVPNTCRYRLAPRGSQITAALFALRSATPKQILREAA